MSSAKKNMVVAQSGGPTCVINSSLRGVVEAARQFDNVGTVYGACHGIEGVLKEELLDLTAQSAEEIALLRYTPVAGSIGTCRYKIKSWQNEDYDRIVDVFAAHNVGYFLYNGGNDSMDTAHKIAEMAAKKGLDVQAVGVPKTIDNDVGDSEFKLIDHTPGYGSVAKYWMHAVQYANEENKGSCPADPVLVMQAMGRKIGFIPAAAGRNELIVPLILVWVLGWALMLFGASLWECPPASKLRLVFPTGITDGSSARAISLAALAAGLAILVITALKYTA